MKRYIIVEVDERLPTASDQYYTNQGLLDFNPKNNDFWDDTDTYELYPNWWLEEVEENELAELLQEAINHLDETKWEDHQVETLGNFCMNAQNVVWNHLNNAPNLMDD